MESLYEIAFRQNGSLSSLFSSHFAALRILCGCRPTLSPTDSELHDELFLEIVLRAEKRWHQIQRRQQVKRTQTGPT